MTLFLRIVAVFLLVIVTTLSWSTPVGAYTSSTNTYSQKAVTYVKSYVSRLQRDGYSEDEVLDQIMNLRSIFIKRQQASLYSGRSSTEVTMIIAELESAISWYSARVGNGYNCGNSYYSCTYQNQYYQPYQPNYNSYQQYQYQYQYYQYPIVSNQTIRVDNASLMTNTSTSTDTRVSLSRANSPYGNRDYDVFTYSPQANGSTNNQPVSSHFLSVNLARELSTAQGRTIRVLFGAEYTQDRVRTIRSLAQGSYRNSQISTSVSTSFVDSFYSPSADEFYRQAIPSGSQRIYKTYKVYIAKDDSQAFVVEYQETGPLNAPTTITQNITGIDTSSFVDYQAYFVHNYRTYGYSKQYKQYLYIPSRDTNISSIISNLGIESRMRYHMGTSRFFPISNERTTTYINGYTVNSGYVSYVESIFSSYGNPTYITLPASNTQFSFYPQTSYNFSNVRLSDGTYRMYRLLVAIDGSEAYMTEYIENNPYY